MPHKVVVELMGRAIPLLNAIPINDAVIRGRMQGGGSWFRSRPAEAVDWRKLMMIEELTSLGARAGYK